MSDAKSTANLHESENLVLYTQCRTNVNRPNQHKYFFLNSTVILCKKCQKFIKYPTKYIYYEIKLRANEIKYDNFITGGFIILT